MSLEGVQNVRQSCGGCGNREAATGSVVVKET
jgi:hypothetical protein